MRKKGEAMKRVQKKLIVITLIVITLCGFVFSSKSYADGNELLNMGNNFAGGIAAILLWVKRVELVGISFIADYIIGQIACAEGVNYRKFDFRFNYSFRNIF